MLSVRCLTLFFALYITASFALESYRVEDDYEVFPSLNSSQYKLYTLHLTWAEALSLCQGDGGGSHLLVINSHEEADIIRQMFTLVTDPEVWSLAVGMSDLATEGTWVTIQGELVSASGYNTWEHTEPDGGTTQNCGVVDRDALLYDYSCTFQQPLICEKPNVL